MAMRQWSSTNYKHQELTRAIIGAALAKELESRGVSAQRQAEIVVRYRGEIVGQFKADLLVERAVIVELKATKALTEVDEAQILNYLKATDIELGLLLNFGEPSLRCKRLVFSNQRKSAQSAVTY